jgi:putative DNA primase/helicase
VLIVEGEKTADAAALLFPRYVVATSPGGARAANKADWAPLKGRKVVIWPDHDEDGRRYAADVARGSQEAGAITVGIVEVPASFPAKWDLADALPEHWTTDRLAGLLQGATTVSRPFEQVNASAGVCAPFRLTARAVEYREEDEEGNERWTLVCSRLEILAKPRDENAGEWGRVVRVVNGDRTAHDWVMPMTMLAGDGQAYRERLFSMGLVPGPGAKSKSRLQDYLLSTDPAATARCVSRLGWHDKSYVMPDLTFGAAPEPVLFQTENATDYALRVSGDLVGWQIEIGRLCVGNSRLAFAVSLAFAAPLLHGLGEESGGFHYRGTSSVGKTTALRVAGSVWGGGGVQGYLRTWRATGNGIEAVAQAHCDGLLCLDELGEVDGRDVGPVAYMLANGEGKSRARRDGSGRPAARWRILFLSSGEVSLAAKMTEAGRAIHAGQEARFIDIPADAGTRLGLFETLHSHPSADSLARHLRAATGRFYGAPIRAYLERLTETEGVVEMLRPRLRRFVANVCPPGADGQVGRVAQRFALVAAAGWLATRMGILPWSEDEAERAARVIFLAWLDSRGGDGSAEALRSVRQVRRFLEEHGESRFTQWDCVPADRPTHNRAGFRRTDNDRTEFFVFPEVFRAEVCAGLDFNAAVQTLRAAGYLAGDNQGKSTSSVRLPGFGKSARVYRLNGDALLADEK